MLTTVVAAAAGNLHPTYQIAVNDRHLATRGSGPCYLVIYGPIILV